MVERMQFWFMADWSLYACHVKWTNSVSTVKGFIKKFNHKIFQISLFLSRLVAFPICVSLCKNSITFFFKMPLQGDDEFRDDAKFLGESCEHQTAVACLLIVNESLLFDSFALHTFGSRHSWPCREGEIFNIPHADSLLALCLTPPPTTTRLQE